MDIEARSSLKLLNMRYSRLDRKAIGNLSSEQMKFFGILEQIEEGEFVAIPELCGAIHLNPVLVAFSCLSGDGATEELEMTIGTLFETRLLRATENFLGILKENGCNMPFTVILDDCEPRRVWRWGREQKDITDWCKMVIEDSDIPNGWSVNLWSDLEGRPALSFEDVLAEMSKPTYALVIHQHLEYMRKFPNKKLIGNFKGAALRRVAGYAFQGLILEQKMPEAILCQTETPWSVKDPIYNPLRQIPLPIIHPYPERR